VRERPIRERNATLSVRVEERGLSLGAWRRAHRRRHLETLFPAASIEEDPRSLESGEAVLFRLEGLGDAYAGYAMHVALVKIERRWVTLTLLFDAREPDRYGKVLLDCARSLARVDANYASAGDANADADPDADAPRTSLAGTISWARAFEPALSEARRDGKPVLVTLHHDSQAVCGSIVAERVEGALSVRDLRRFLDAGARAHSAWRDEDTVDGPTERFRDAEDPIVRRSIAPVRPPRTGSHASVGPRRCRRSSPDSGKSDARRSASP